MQENAMVSWVRQLDRLLRGEATRLSSLRQGVIDVSPDGLSLLILVLGAIYGACMGSYSIFRPAGASWPQFVATIGKVPLLFLLTLVVTFPSLYVFNALVGSRLSLSSVFRLIVAALAVMLAVLASFGPIVAFFSASTTSYAFMTLLNVAMFTVAGSLGLKFLLTTLHRLSHAALEVAREESAREITEIQRAHAAAHLLIAPPLPVDQATGEPMDPALQPDFSVPPHPGMPPLPIVPGMPSVTPQMQAQQMYDRERQAGALTRLDQRTPADVITVFRIWIIVFGLVGAQMSWVLRPFLGAPGRDFTLFSPREGNFFQVVLHQLWSFIGR